MATPKEKADELFKKMKGFRVKHSHSKKCAIVAVDEIIEQWEYIDTYISDLGGKLNPNLKYWQEVKSELEKL